jgi:hypothetical protein
MPSLVLLMLVLTPGTSPGGGALWGIDGTILDPVAMSIDRRHDPGFQCTGVLSGTDGHEVGDNINFWALDHSVSPLTFYLTPATCRYAGSDCYIFVEDSQWESEHFTQEGVDELAAALEDSTPGGYGGIIDTDEQFFGPIPDELDGDPRVYFLVLDIRDGYDPSSSEPQLVVLGFFSPYNQFTDQEAWLYYGGHSNECEMLYIDCYPATMDDASYVSSHELVHLIQWGLKPFSGEELWVIENQAQTGVYLCGYPAEQVQTFLEAGGVTPIKWTGYPDDERFAAGYGAGFLWFAWLFENYGGADFIWNSMRATARGLAGVTEAIELATGYSPVMEDVLRDWMLANWIDDTGFGSGIYGYETFRVADYDTGGNRTGLDYNGVVETIPWADPWHTMNSFSGNYYRIGEGLSGSFRAEGSGIGHLDAYHFDGPAGILTRLDTGSANDVALSLSEDGDVLLLCNSFAVLELDVSAGSIQGSGSDFAVYPDPCFGDLYFQFESSGAPVSIAVFDASGYHVETAEYPSPGTGEVTLTYQGASELASGIYFYRFAQGSHVETGKFAAVR